MTAYPLSATDVSASVRATLMAYLPTVLRNTPRPLPEPNSYEQTPTAEAIQRVNGSTLAVICTGTSGGLERYGGDGDLDWTVLVSVWHENTKATPLLVAAADYAAAVRHTLLTRCPPIAESVEYRSESQELVSDELSNRYLGSATVEFTVRTGSLGDYTATPAVNGPVVLTTDVQHNTNP